MNTSFQYKPAWMYEFPDISIFVLEICNSSMLHLKYSTILQKYKIYDFTYTKFYIHIHLQKLSGSYLDSE